MEIKISDKYLWITIVVCVAVGFLLAVIGFFVSAFAGRDLVQALGGHTALVAGIALAAIPYLLTVSIQKMLSVMSGDTEAETGS